MYNEIHLRITACNMLSFCSDI